MGYRTSGSNEVPLEACRLSVSSRIDQKLVAFSFGSRGGTRSAFDLHSGMAVAFLDCRSEASGMIVRQVIRMPQVVLVVENFVLEY